MSKSPLIAVITIPLLLLAGCGPKGSVETAGSNNAAHSDDALESIVVTGTVQSEMPPAPPPPPVAMSALVAAPRAVGMDRATMSPADTERYQNTPANPVYRVAEAPVSTFSVDVDTASYANVRRFLVQGQRPPTDAVRVEEMINYFRYDYTRPTDRKVPFAITTDVAATPWNPGTRLLRVALRGYDVTAAERPPANLVFLVDVSGSMDSPDKLPLVQASLRRLTARLRPDDRVAIVVYAGAAGLVLPSTNDKAAILAAVERLKAGGSTAGGEGLMLAYATARASYIKGGINRILLATDGDFNVGITSDERLEDLVSREKDSGITLTTLGFGTGNYNDAMMETIADAGNGNAAYIDSAIEADKVLGEELESTLFTIAGDVKVQVEFNPRVIAEYRLIGYENRILAEEDFDNDKVDAGDIGAGHRVTALYEVALVGGPGLRLPERRYTANRPVVPAGSAAEMAVVKLRYKLPGERTSRLIEQPLAASLAATTAPPKGEFAFAAAVAAFGQKLAGSKYLGDYSWAQITALAGPQSDYSRSEFIKLVGLAGASNSSAGE
jgi:Ca-activated chloride channel family protein